MNVLKDSNQNSSFVKLIDSHAHLTCDGVFENLPEVLKRAEENGIEHIVNICTDQKTLERGLELSEKYPWIYNTGATTPHDVEKEGEALFPLFEKTAKDGKLVAIGETGLDYYYEHSNRDLQKLFLERYFDLAKSTQLPVVIHCREAFEDLFAIADEVFPGGSAVLHCFTGTLEEAKKVVDRGWYLSLSGILTFKKSVWLREVAEVIPLEHLLIETDTPYLAPQSRRGKPNEPSYVKETAEMLAKTKELTLERVAEVTAENAKVFFQIQ